MLGKIKEAAKAVSFASLAVVYFGGLLVRSAVDKALSKFGGDQ